MVFSDFGRAYFVAIWRAVLALTRNRFASKTNTERHLGHLLTKSLRRHFAVYFFAAVEWATARAKSLEFLKRFAGMIAALNCRVPATVLGEVTSEAYRVACHRHEKGIKMFKSKTAENGGNGAANGAEVVGAMALPQRSAAHQGAGRAESTPVSCIGSGMSIVGSVECSGSAQVFGRIEGELRASDLLIGEGAQVQGSVIAQEVTVSGSVKGTIRAVRVTLHGGTVEGDIFNRSLSIDENSVFEGASRRDENPTERRRENGAQPSSSVIAKGPQKKNVESPSLAPSLAPSTLPSIDAAVQSTGIPAASRLP